MWTDGFGECFAREFGYRVEPYMPRLDDEPDVRYDYRRLLSRLVLDEFYQPFAEVCHEHGALARVQWHGAPTDLIAAYAAVDVPESETLLFDPPFSTIVASAWSAVRPSPACMAGVGGQAPVLTMERRVGRIYG